MGVKNRAVCPPHLHRRAILVDPAFDAHGNAFDDTDEVAKGEDLLFASSSDEEAPQVRPLGSVFYA